MAAQRLVIVVWSADPERPAHAAAPFVYALAARALDIEVEMHFTATAVRWLFDGVAAQAYTDRAHTKRVLDYLREAKAAGVKLYACAMARHEHGPDAPLLPEVDGIAGAAAVIGAVMEAGTKVLVF
jgi:hypothetical protein